jgi:hypothetical protein
VEEAHAVVRRVQQSRRKALPHLISSELRFQENLDLFKNPSARAFWLQNYAKKSMMHSILRFTGVGNLKLYRLDVAQLLQRIYNYANESMFKSEQETKPALMAIANWDHLRKSAVAKETLPVETKLISDLVKGVLKKDIIFSIDRGFFEAGLQATAIMPGPGIIDELCAHVAKPAAEGSHDVSPNSITLALVRTVFAKVINTNPENRHLQHVAGSQSSSSYIVVNKLVNCFQMADGGIAFANIDATPLHIKLDAMLAPNATKCMASIATWKVS